MTLQPEDFEWPGAGGLAEPNCRQPDVPSPEGGRTAGTGEVAAVLSLQGTSHPKATGKAGRYFPSEGLQPDAGPRGRESGSHW